MCYSNMSARALTGAGSPANAPCAHIQPPSEGAGAPFRVTCGQCQRLLQPAINALTCGLNGQQNSSAFSQQFWRKANHWFTECQAHPGG